MFCENKCEILAFGANLPTKNPKILPIKNVSPIPSSGRLARSSSDNGMVVKVVRPAWHSFSPPTSWEVGGFRN